MPRSLLQKLDRLLLREPSFEAGPAELILTFAPGPGDSFAVHARSPAVDDGAQGLFRIPWTGAAAARLVRRLRGSGRNLAAVTPSSRKAGQPPSPREAGRALFEALFADPAVRRLYDELRSAEPKGGLRLRLVLDPVRPGMAQLHALPWELLTDPGTGQILALERGVSVIRTLRVSRPSAPFEHHQPLRVLALFSGADDLALESERRELERVGREVGGLKVEVGPATDLSGLEDRLARGLAGRPFHVLHLAGHGEVTAGPRGGVLAWKPPGKAPTEVAGRALSTLLRRAPDLGLVVINACSTADLPEGSGDPFAGLAAALLQGGIPAVVAVQGAIRDEAAVAFSSAFYAGLAAGASPEEAMARARWALWKAEPEGLEWAKPVLFQGATPQRLAPWLRRTAAGLVLALVLLAALVLVQQIHLATRTLQRRVGDARTLLQSGRPVEASQILEGALATRSWPRPSPEAVASAHSTAALAAQDLGHLTRAIAHASEAVRLEPDRAVYQYNLGALLARSGRPGEAALHLRRALALDPGLAEASNELGCVELTLGRSEQALRVLEQGVAVAPRDPLLRKNLGRALLASGHPAQAARSIARALALLPAADWPERAEASFWLARAAAARRDDPETCRALERLREADPQGVTQWVPQAASLARAAHCPGAAPSSPVTTGGPSAR